MIINNFNMFSIDRLRSDPKKEFKSLRFLTSIPNGFFIFASYFFRNSKKQNNHV